jgi:hypothetical protein
MIQISQYFGSQYTEIYLLIFVLISLVVFFSLIIKSFKEKNNAQNQEQALKRKRLKRKSRTMKSITIGEVFNITTYKIIPIVYIIFLLFWSLISFIPASINHLIPADSEQSVTFTNNTNQDIDFVLVGRLSYSNTWRPIIPYSPFFQGSAMKNLEKDESISMKLRTGVKDIDHLMVVNFSKEHNTDKYSRDVRGIILSVPSNGVFLYSGQLKELVTKPSVFLLSIIFNICLYFSAIICCLCIFFTLFNRSSYNLKRTIILSSSCLVISTFFGFTFWWNLDLLLRFL